MNVLEVKDILNLSLFHCKLCGNRLQRPIIQITTVGNFCGCCYEVSCPGAIALRNMELEALLSDLYLPCNYARKGCKVNGFFNDICDHEILCCFRKKSCPLKSVNLCEDDLTSLDELIEHFKRRHAQNVVHVTPDYISVKNPDHSISDTFYLLVVDEMYFMLRAKFDMFKGRILYEFYCCNYNVQVTNVNFSIVLKYDNSTFNMSDMRVRRLHEGEFPYVLNIKDASKISLATLESFDCLKNIIIRVDTNVGLPPKATINDTLWFQCKKCLNISNEVVVGRNRNFGRCGVPTSTCDSKAPPGDFSHPMYPHRYGRRRGHFLSSRFTNRHLDKDPNTAIPTVAPSTPNNTYAVHQLCMACNEQSGNLGFRNFKRTPIPVRELDLKTAFTCKNAGCEKEIRGDEYDRHCNLECRFREYHCNALVGSKVCDWKDVAFRLGDHLKNRHPNIVNVWSVVIAVTESSKQRYFLKEKVIFCQDYLLTPDGLFTVTTKRLLELDFRSEYMWQIYFQHPTAGHKTIISSSYTDYGCANTTYNIDKHLLLFNRVKEQASMALAVNFIRM
ncbi:hypothetical protein Trydic_g2786 [Trypoxylus dichotomus]